VILSQQRSRDLRSEEPLPPALPGQVLYWILLDCHDTRLGIIVTPGSGRLRERWGSPPLPSLSPAQLSTPKARSAARRGVASSLLSMPLLDVQDGANFTPRTLGKPQRWQI